MEQSQSTLKQLIYSMLIKDGENIDDAESYANEVSSMMSDEPWKGFAFVSKCILDLEYKVDYLIEHLAKIEAQIILPPTSKKNGENKC